MRDSSNESLFSTGQLESLHHLLESEIEQYQQAVDALQRKKMALVTRKPKSLIHIDRELMAIGRQCKHMESRRRSMMSEMGHTHGRLKTMISAMTPANAGRFEALRIRLLRAIQDVGQLNRESKSLLELSLNWLQETVTLIATAIAPEGASYNAQGGKRKAADIPLPVRSTVNHSI